MELNSLVYHVVKINSKAAPSKLHKIKGHWTVFSSIKNRAQFIEMTIIISFVCKTCISAADKRLYKYYKHDELTKKIVPQI